MPAHVEMEALVVRRPREPTHHVKLLEHDGPMAELGQLVRCGQPGGPSAHDHELSLSLLILCHRSPPRFVGRYGRHVCSADGGTYGVAVRKRNCHPVNSSIKEPLDYGFCKTANAVPAN